MTNPKFIKKMNTKFNLSYSNHIYPKYLTKKLPTQQSIIEKITDICKIHNRILIDTPCITIDPPGCKDADDGFCLYKLDNRLYLAIHIADPTCYIDSSSDYFDSICKNSITHYPSMHMPIHLLPDNIVKESSLSTNGSTSEIKKAVSVITEIDTITFKPINKPQLQFTNIKILKNNNFTYENASKFVNYNNSFKYLITINQNKVMHNVESFDIDTSINLAYIISQVMKESRITIGKSLSYNMSNIRYINGVPELYNDPEQVKCMKEMIAEFAIFSNTFVGEYLSEHSKEDSKSLGIYRMCDASDLKMDLENLTMVGDKLMDKIIKSNISAKYTPNEKSHDLVGSMKYTHFTSPIRRASDCICHFLLKYIHLKKIDPATIPPFTEEKLKTFVNIIDIQTKIEKKLQHADNKFRTIQALANIVVLKSNANISLMYNGFANAKTNYLNLKIKKINKFNVSISLTLKINKNVEHVIEHFKRFNDDNLLTINIQYVNVPRRYDDDILPDLQKYIQKITN